MTNITKAAEMALAVLDRIYIELQVDDVMPARGIVEARKQLRAALQDKAGEVRQFRRVGCADWYDGNPDHEDGRGPYEARTLYAAQPAPVVPDDHPLMVFAKECRLGSYTDHEVIQEAGKALAASRKKGGSAG